MTSHTPHTSLSSHTPHHPIASPSSHPYLKFYFLPAGGAATPSNLVLEEELGLVLGSAGANGV